MSGDQPLGRLLALALTTVVDELHDRLERAGWPKVRPMWGFVLLALRDGRHNVRDVGDLLGVTKQAAAKVVASLLEEGLVERHEDPLDRRAVVLGLTVDGVRFLADAEAAYSAIEAGWVDVVGRKSVDDLRSTIGRVLQAKYGGDEPGLRPAL